LKQPNNLEETGQNVSVSEKYLYGVVCLDQLEKAGMMDIFLTMAANISNATVMA